jgi:DNA-binding NarL/FixJ family response regulator
MSIRVAIVEDREEVRRGLGYVIGSADGFVMVGEFADAESALARLDQCVPDVILMDIELPGMNGIEAVKLVRQRRPATSVMMLTVYEDEVRIFDSLRAGATGYVLKTTPTARLLEAITALHQGGSPMSSQIARRVVEVFHQQGPVDPAAELTPREREILELLAHGYRYREIGTQLDISLDTVRTHIRHIYEKMQVRSRTEATARYLKWGGGRG